MNTAYLLLGGNKGDKLQNLKDAICLLKKQVGNVSKHSAIYVTAAWGNSNQPDFYNQVICIETTLSAQELLKQTISIEESLGRIRTEKKWEQRTMDIDILFYNDEIIDTPDLKIPHPYIQERNFVLIPMEQIAAQYIHPKFKKNITLLLSNCKDSLEVRRLIE